MQLKYRALEFQALQPYVEAGDTVHPNMGMSYRPMEHFSLGFSGGIAMGIDPWDRCRSRRPGSIWTSSTIPTGRPAGSATPIAEP